MKPTATELLNSVRERALRLPQGHKMRTRYRDLRRACANVREDAAATGGTSADVDSIYATVERFVSEFEAACSAGYYTDRDGNKHAMSEPAEPPSENDNSIINALKRLERAGSETSKTTEKLITAAVEVAQGIVDRVPREVIDDLSQGGMYEVELPTGRSGVRYSLADCWYSQRSVVLVQKCHFTDKWVNRAVNYSDVRTQSLTGPTVQLGCDREVALHFAQDIANGLLTDIADWLELATKKNEEAAGVLEEHK